MPLTRQQENDLSEMAAHVQARLDGALGMLAAIEQARADLGPDVDAYLLTFWPKGQLEAARATLTTLRDSLAGRIKQAQGEGLDELRREKTPVVTDKGKAGQ